jgi:hypothetical protein
MGGACGTHGGKKEIHIGFWLVNMRERYHLEDLDVDGRIILKLILNKYCNMKLFLIIFSSFKTQHSSNFFLCRLCMLYSAHTCVVL